MRFFGNRGIVHIRDSPNQSVDIMQCPEVLYRYVSPPYDAQFVDGMLQIKPLAHYASIEDSARRDAEEQEKLHRIPEGELPAFPSRAVGYDHPCIAEDNEERVEPPLSYCLCFSHVASRELARKWRASCIRVERVPSSSFARWTVSFVRGPSSRAAPCCAPLPAQSPTNEGAKFTGRSRPERWSPDSSSRSIRSRARLSFVSYGASTATGI